MPGNAQFHLSHHRLEGSLCDVSLAQVLAECFTHQVTGMVQVSAFGRRGVVELRAGAVESVEFGELRGDAALDVLGRVRAGSYEVVQRLPDLGGDLGSAAELQGTTAEVPLVKLMRYCEDHALTCTVTVVSEFDRAVIQYQSGDIVEISLNGDCDEDRILDILRFESARFRVSAPPLDLNIDGWPACGRAPTAPFVVQAHAKDPDLEALGEAEPYAGALIDDAECAEITGEWARETRGQPELLAPSESRAQPQPRPQPEPELDVPLVGTPLLRRPLPLVAAGAVVLTGIWLYLMALAIA